MADEKRDEGSGGNHGSRRPGEGPEGRPEGGRRHGGRHRSFHGRQAGQGQPGRPRAGEGGDGQRGAADAPKDPRPEEKRELLTCPLCGKALYDLSTALSAGVDSTEPAHFDCVLERVAAAEALGPGEKIVYLGSGTFGVVEFKDKSETAFSVKRRIQWEKEGEKKEWRKALSSRISSL
jgi:hypothetical protein